MRVISDPNEPAEADNHTHLCSVCHTAWQHSDMMFGNIPEHTCPTCGNEVWNKYWTCNPSQRLVEAHDIDCVRVWYVRLSASDTERQRAVRSEIARQYLGDF